MATTASSVIQAAVQRSAVTNPDLIPVAQALMYISKYESQLYLRAGRLNPEYFGAQGDLTRTTATDAFDLNSLNPAAGVVTRVTVKTIAGTVSGVSVGDQINLVNFRNPLIQVLPRAYIRGRKLYGYGSDLGSGTNYVSGVTVYYSQLPAAVTKTTDTLSLPDEFVNIVVLKLAKVFAIRDRRLDEIEALNMELQEEINLFDEAILAYEAGATRQLAAVPAIPLPPPSR